MFSKETIDLFLLAYQSFLLPFNYEKTNASFSELNFIYIIHKNCFEKIKQQIGISPEHHFIEESAANQTQINTDNIIDIDQQKRIFQSQNEKFQSLNIILKEIPEDELEFLNLECFQFIESIMIKNQIQIIKKVVFEVHDQIKVELYQPLVNVLFIDSSFDIQNFNSKNIKNQIKTISISRYMNLIDLYELLREVAEKFYNSTPYDFHSKMIFLPEDHDLNKDNLKRIIKGKVTSQIIQGNLSSYDIYNHCILVFQYCDKYSKLKIKPLQKNQLKQKGDKKGITYQCYSCSNEIDNFTAFVCICKQTFCDKDCYNQKRDHQCSPQKCLGCNYKMINSDLGKVLICDCSEILCSSRCLENHQIKTKCNKELIKPLLKNYHINNGIVGLQNIGNTCYMNSALQCLLHTEDLKNILLYKDFETEINQENPLGSKGQVIKEFIQFFREYYMNQKDRMKPISLKAIIDINLKTFEGWSQHDSQEFLSQFLDIMHEDINRIINKPYTQNIEGTQNDNDQKLGRQSWVNFLKRNYSFFINLFYGQFKSQVQCCDCNFITKTFDPYQIISLNIPKLEQQQQDIFFFPKNHSSRALKYTLKFQSCQNFQDLSLKGLKEIFSKELKKDINTLTFGALGFQKFGHMYDDNDTVQHMIQDRNIQKTKPKLVLIEWSEMEVIEKSKNQSQYVYFKTNSYIHDQQNINKEYLKDKDYQKNRNYQEDPILTIVSILDLDQYTVQDLYVLAFIKIFNATNLKNESKSNENNFFRKFLNDIYSKKNGMFFYLKYGQRKLNYQDQTILRNIHLSNDNFQIYFYFYDQHYSSIQTNITSYLNVISKSVLIYAKNIQRISNKLSLEFLIENFRKTEILDVNNTWRCSKCKKEVQAKKTIQIYKLPKILIFQLKKIKTSSSQNSLIDFPIENLNMNNYCVSQSSTQDYNIMPEEFYSETDIKKYQQYGKNLIIQPIDNQKVNLMYDLYGVINHYGSQMFGHYKANCKMNDNRWFEFNDGSCSQIDESEIVSPAAYILFYKRKNQN